MTTSNLFAAASRLAVLACAVWLSATPLHAQTQPLGGVLLAQANDPVASQKNAGTALPKDKQTSLGLYVTAQEAYAMWKADPQRVKLIDVRTPEEYAFIGHPAGAWNIPFAFVTYHSKDGKFEHAAQPNADFVAEVKKLAGPQDTLLVMCRSGNRSAQAIELLAAAGITRAYNVTDGFEGDKVNDPGSVHHGKRMRNGWKNSAPWVYTIDPEKVILTEGTARVTQRARPAATSP